MPPGHSQPYGAEPHMGMQNPQGVDFGKDCGISDTSAQSAARFSRSPEGEWSTTRQTRFQGHWRARWRGSWRESNWLVDMHDAPGHGMTSMHTGQMCFDRKRPDHEHG